MAMIQQVTDSNGNVIGAYVPAGGVTVFVRQEDLPTFLQNMGGPGAGGGYGGGGRFDLTQASDAAQAAYDMLTSDNMRSLALRARDERRELARMKDALRELPDSVSTATLRDKVAAILDKQADVDRAQTEAIELGYKVTFANGLAAGGRFLGRLSGGGGGNGGMGMNMSAILPTIAALGVAAIIWDDDDDGRRGRRRW